jgi:hypothetical protein
MGHSSILPRLTRQNLGPLRYGWGEAYRIGYCEDHGYRARRRDGLGEELRARTHGELWAAMQADYNDSPVPRDYSQPIDSEGSGLDHDLPHCCGGDARDDDGEASS